MPALPPGHQHSSRGERVEFHDLTQPGVLTRPIIGLIGASLVLCGTADTWDNSFQSLHTEIEARRRAVKIHTFLLYVSIDEQDTLLVIANAEQLSARFYR